MAQFPGRNLRMVKTFLSERLGGARTKPSIASIHKDLNTVNL